MKRSTILLLILVLAGCSWNRDRLDIDVSHVKIGETRIHRYDRDLFKVSPNQLIEGLAGLQKEYGYFLGTNLNDTANLAKMMEYLVNPRNLEFHQACQAAYPDLGSEEEELHKAFAHFKYYFPETRLPGVYSYISGGDYANRVEISDTVMIIALDDYLGPDFKLYQEDGVPVYRRARMTKEHIVPDCMSALIYSLYPVDPSVMTLLGQMIEAGKRIYLLEAFMPDSPDTLWINYSESQYNWIRKNEAHVWGAIIENRMLYSSKGEVTRVFLADGPFTTEFTQESPPRIGEFIGWHIVSEYMERNKNITLQQLMEDKDYQKILSVSGYKPGK